MNRLDHTLARLGHVATRRQLLAHGFTGNDLASAVHRAQLTRIRRGWYASAAATTDQRDAVFVGGRMSHTTAARSYGLWAGLDPELHVTVTRGASRLRALPPERERPVRVHWITPGRQPLTARETWRVPLADCVRQVVESSERETAVACVDTAITKYGLSRATLASWFEAEGATSRARVALARAGSDSGLESIVRQRLERAGLRVRQQVAIPTVGRVDFVVGRSLVIEVDGREFHDRESSFEKDRVRDARLTIAGYTVLRLTYRQVLFGWLEAYRAILAAAARAG